MGPEEHSRTRYKQVGMAKSDEINFVVVNEDVFEGTQSQC